MLLVVFDTFDCSYSYNTPISEASYRFFKVVLSIYLSESNGLWLQHGVIIRGDQRRAISSHPEEHMIDDVIFWDPLSVSLSLTLWCPNCLEYSGAHQPLKAARWNDGRTTCDDPRHFYGSMNDVLLVSRVYVCDRRHQIIDPSIF